MAVRGAKPKDDDQKVTRHPLTQDWVDVVDVPYSGKKPGLPSKVRYVVKGAMLEQRMPTQTRAWWKRVTAMPHCVLWTETDWQFALDTAMVHAAFMLGDTVRAGEVRVREKQMGTTLESRRDLRIRYVPAEDLAPATDTPSDPHVTSFEAERRRRIAGGA